MELGFEVCTSSCSAGISGSGDGQFAQPAGIGVNLLDQVYVADSQNNRIQYFDLNGSFLGKWGSTGSSTGQFNNPVGVTTDEEGDVFVADYGNDRVQKFTSNGTFLSTWGYTGGFEYGFDGPFGITAASGGKVYISDQNNQRIKQYRVTKFYLDDEPEPNEADQVDHEIQYVGKPGSYKMTEIQQEVWYLDSIVCETTQVGDDPVVVLPTVFIELGWR